MAGTTSSTSTYIVARPGYDTVEVADVSKVEFIAGQNRVTFYDANNNCIASYEGQGLDFHKKA